MEEYQLWWGGAQVWSPSSLWLNSLEICLDWITLKKKRISSVQTLQIMNVPRQKRYALELAGEGRCWPTRGVSLTPEHRRKVVEPLFTGLWVCILWECPEDTNYFMGPSPPMQRQRSNRTLVLTATGIGSYLIASPLVTVHSQCREKQGSGGGQDRAVHGVCFRVDFLSSSSRNCRNIQRGDGGFYSSWRACGKGQRSKHSGRHLVTHISPPTCVVQVGMLDPSRAVYVLVKSSLMTMSTLLPALSSLQTLKTKVFSVTAM